MYQQDVVATPVHPTILDDVINEFEQTRTDDNITRSYLEQIIAEHQSECIIGHRALDFISHIETDTDGFVAGYTDSYAYLVVEKHDVWRGEAEWMPWDDTDEYLLTTAYTREVLDIGKSDTADWAIDGLDVSKQAGYIVPIPFPLHSISTEPAIETDPLALANDAASLAAETVLEPTVADCLVLFEAIDQSRTEALSTAAHLLGVGVSEVEAMLSHASQTVTQAKRTTEALADFDVVRETPESFYQ